MDRLFPFECRTRQETLDGHAALSYDAAETIINAVEYLQASGLNVPITPGTVWHAISSLHGSTWAYAGQSGQIDFGGVVTQHVPLDKAIAMMQAQGGGLPVRKAFCGASGSLSLPQQSWCRLP